MNKRALKKSKTLLLLLFILAMTAGSLTLRFSYVIGGAFPFAQELILVFLGAIATTLVTSMLLNKQTELELQKEAKVMLFDQKHQIYMDTIEKVAEIVEKRAFDSKIFDDLRVLNHKVAMIGSVSVIETFYKVLQKMQSGFQDGNIQQQEAETIMHFLAEVTFEMRKDLLQEISDQEDDRIFDAILENSRGVEKIENTGQS